MDSSRAGMAELADAADLKSLQSICAELPPDATRCQAGILPMKSPKAFCLKLPEIACSGQSNWPQN